MESKDDEKEKRLKAIRRLGELLEKTGATPEETIKIIREIRGKDSDCKKVFSSIFSFICSLSIVFNLL